MKTNRKLTGRFLLLTKVVMLFFLVMMASSILLNRIHPVSLERKESRMMEVEVKGAVHSPGTYSFLPGARVEDLVESAEGLLEEADTETISMVQPLSDGQVIVIPSIDEQEEMQSRISISSASAEELQELPGIGPAMAQRIIEYRESTPFSCLEDLMNVKGIGEKTFEKMKEQIVL